MSESRGTVLEVSNFGYAYGRDEVVQDVSFKVQHGEFVTIIGPNGAGKSTILKCVMRILAGGRGTITVDGRPLATYHQRDLAKILSYVPQSEKGVMPWTVREFVLMGRYPYLGAFRDCGPDDQKAVQEVLELTGMAPFAERFLGSLSGGERQTVMIAAALAQEADLLLLDEPATFLDPRHQDNINRLLHRLTNRERKAILAVTHDINAAAMTSDRVLGLKQGRVVFSGTPGELMTPAVLEMIYEKRFTLVDHPQTGRKVIVPEAVS